MIESILRLNSADVTAGMPIFGVFVEEDGLHWAAESVPAPVTGELRQAYILKRFQNKEPGTLVQLPPEEGLPHGAALLHWGKAEDFNGLIWQKTLSAALDALRESEALIAPDANALHNLSRYEAAHRFASLAYDLYGKPLNLKRDASDVRTPRLYWIGDDEEALLSGGLRGCAKHFVRRIADTPANLCTPLKLAEEMQSWASGRNTVTCTVWQREELTDKGFGGLLAVAQGSAAEPVFIELTYRGTDASVAPIALVGKGITFDSGGLSLKPAAKMGDMIYDMCGAAAVLGAFRFAAEANLPLNLVALVPACENMPSGQATRPGDIVRTLSGRTVEIQNTDAEGRMILCDALTHALTHKPALMIDVATLTGACVVALGDTFSGLFANDEELAAGLQSAAAQSGDLVWRMPLHADYRRAMRSRYADLCNISGGREAGACTAAAFLEVFVEKTPWAHLDIAGTSNTSGKDHAATARPFDLLADFLVTRAKR